MSENEANYVLMFYSTTATDAVRITAINLIGFSILLFTASLLRDANIERTYLPINTRLNNISIQNLFWLFFTIRFCLLLIVNIIFNMQANDK